MWLDISAVVADFTAYTYSKGSSLKQLGQVTTVPRQLVPASQSNSLENVDWEICLPTEMRGVHPHAIATAVSCCVEEDLTTLTTHLPGSGGSAQMPGTLQVQTTWWVGLQQYCTKCCLENCSENILGDALGLSSNQICKFYLLVILSLLNIASSLNEIIECTWWFLKNSVRNSTRTV
jgi:hypothetical protein